MLPGGGSVVAFCGTIYWPWVGGICKCLGADARGLPGVNPQGWPLISALLSFEQLLDYFIWRRVGWWRDGWLVAWWLAGGVMVSWWRVGWWRNSLVVSWPDRIQWQVIGTIKHIHIHIRYTSTSPLPENRKDKNRKVWKLKDVKIVAAEVSLINSVPVLI